MAGLSILVFQQTCYEKKSVKPPTASKAKGWGKLHTPYEDTWSALSRNGMLEYTERFKCPLLRILDPWLSGCSSDPNTMSSSPPAIQNWSYETHEEATLRHPDRKTKVQDLKYATRDSSNEGESPTRKKARQLLDCLEKQFLPLWLQITSTVGSASYVRQEEDSLLSYSTLKSGSKSQNFWQNHFPDFHKFSDIDPYLRVLHWSKLILGGHELTRWTVEGTYASQRPSNWPDTFSKKNYSLAKHPHTIAFVIDSELSHSHYITWPTTRGSPSRLIHWYVF